MRSVAEFEKWELEEGGGRGQEWRRLARWPSAGRMSCPEAPRALTWVLVSSSKVCLTDS